jgi:predicted DNA-binding transcriptional regulator YafY
VGAELTLQAGSVRDTSARLLRLLSLLQTRRDWSGPDLAERLGVTVRTVRRDVDRLRGLGYPVHASSGTAGGYRLGAGTALPPLLLDDDEAVAVAVGLRTAAGGTVAGIGETSARALAKLEQVLPARLRSRVADVQAAVVLMAAPNPTVKPDVLAAVAAACRDQHRLRFDYVDRNGNTSLRVTEPHRLVHTGHRWYLVAYDLDRAEWRTFRVDRLHPRRPTGPRFTPREPPGPDLATYTSHAVSTAGYPVQGRFVVHAPAAVIAARIPPTVGVVEALDERTCRLTAGAHTPEDLVLHVAALGAEFEVCGPPELVGTARDLAGRLARAVTRRPPD